MRIRIVCLQNFEMLLGNYAEAQKILYSGAMTLSKSLSSLSSSVTTGRRGIPELFLTWAVCEWHLGNLLHAEKLFEYVLRLSSSDIEESSTNLRSLILYAMARFEYDWNELRRAEHYIGLCLKENSMPGENGKVWDLWATLTHAMGNTKLASQCQEQATLLHSSAQGREGHYDLCHMNDKVNSLPDMLKSSIMHGRPDMYQLMRRDPWHAKLFGNMHSRDQHTCLNAALLPKKEHVVTAK
jgi:tetratricopeptide (TPR) repeat protein